MSTITLVFIKLLSKVKNENEIRNVWNETQFQCSLKPTFGTKKQVIDEVTDIKDLSQIVLRDNCITNIQQILNEMSTDSLKK